VCGLVLTSFDGDDKLFPTIRAGARGYFLKDTGREDLVHAIHDLQGGNSAPHPSVARQVLKALTGRELEVQRLMAQGPSNLEISHLLTISKATERTSVSNILAKLYLGGRAQPALCALRGGLAPLHDTEPGPTRSGTTGRSWIGQYCSDRPCGTAVPGSQQVRCWFCRMSKPAAFIRSF